MVATVVSSTERLTSRELDEAESAADGLYEQLLGAGWRPTAIAVLGAQLTASALNQVAEAELEPFYNPGTCREHLTELRHRGSVAIPGISFTESFRRDVEGTVFAHAGFHAVLRQTLGTLVPLPFAHRVPDLQVPRTL